MTNWYQFNYIGNPMKDNKLFMAIIGPMRLPFLVLVPVCVILGTASAKWTGFQIDLLYLSLAFVGALSAHISVNALNEYDDFKSGLDMITSRTPFSGGSGTLPSMPGRSVIVLITGLISLAVTMLVGIYFIYKRGIWILPLGILGVADILLYTRWLTKNPFLCLIAPGLGFGLMVLGTDFVLTGAYSSTSIFVSMVPFFMVSNLLLLNQFPDAKADETIGRHHLPITMGRRASVFVFAAFIFCAYLTVAFGIVVGVIPLAGLLALLTVVAAVPTISGAYKFADDIPKLVSYMGKNVLVTLLTPLLLAVGLFLA